MDGPYEVLRKKTDFHPTAVHRAGNTVIRDADPWTPTVQALLRHLEDVGFEGAPRVIGSGFDSEGHETISYIPGEFFDTGPWTLEGAASVGVLLRKLHTATRSFRVPADAVWYPWFGRSLGGTERVISHCDVAAWNVVARGGRAIALIDWERAGPVDPLVELAQACWLNAKLHDDLVAEREGLPSVEDRARQMRAIVDGYELSAADRHRLMDRIIEFTVCAAADEADLAHIAPESTPSELDKQVPWALAWRIRAAAWQLRHRAILEQALA
jgi:Ser/Thr protein kinase RdoA (MazF antagonist)